MEDIQESFESFLVICDLEGARAGLDSHVSQAPFVVIKVLWIVRRIVLNLDFEELAPLLGDGSGDDGVSVPVWAFVTLDPQLLQCHAQHQISGTGSLGDVQIDIGQAEGHHLWVGKGLVAYFHAQTAEPEGPGVSHEAFGEAVGGFFRVLLVTDGPVQLLPDFGMVTCSRPLVRSL